MGFAREGVWVMGYCGPMGYGVHFPAHQVGGRPGLWVKRGYGLPEVWVKRGLTVSTLIASACAAQVIDFLIFVFEVDLVGEERRAKTGL